MLTFAEKLIFLAAVAVSIYVSFVQFRRVYGVIRRGEGDLPSRGELAGRLAHAAGRWLTFGNMWKSRGRAGVFHALIAWGFVFYLLVNFGDLLQGYLPIRFLGESSIGAGYRFLADIVTVGIFDRHGLLSVAPFCVACAGAGIPRQYHAGGEGAGRGHWTRLAGCRPVHPAARGVPPAGRELCDRAGAAGDRAWGGGATVRQWRQPVVGRDGRIDPDAGTACGLVGRARAGAGLCAVFPAHETSAPDHGGRELSGAAGAELAGGVAAARFRGRDDRGVRRGAAGAAAVAAPGGCLCLHHVQPLPGCVPRLRHRQGVVAGGAGDQQTLCHQRAGRGDRGRRGDAASARLRDQRIGGVGVHGVRARASTSVRWATSRCSTSCTCGATRR